MTRAPSHGDPLESLPSRSRIAELILGGHPPRDTYVGWQSYRSRRGMLLPAPAISLQQWRTIPESRRADSDLFRHLTNANLPLQDTPMHDKVGRLIRRRLRGNTMKQDDPTRAA